MLKLYRSISSLSNIDKIIEEKCTIEYRNFLIKTRLYISFSLAYSLAVLVNMMEAITKALNDCNFVCGIFVDLLKMFDTVDQSILLSKLGHY